MYSGCHMYDAGKGAPNPFTSDFTLEALRRTTHATDLFISVYGEKVDAFISNKRWAPRSSFITNSFSMEKYDNIRLFSYRIIYLFVDMILSDSSLSSDFFGRRIHIFRKTAELPAGANTKYKCRAKTNRLKRRMEQLQMFKNILTTLLILLNAM